ncbi:putative glucosidase 2 subunit alpha [Venustampulla echinocandica]|uniref:alpha-glucosidase n=1 Tax=Venustampulla echinocandica TaxID=2656787 RepID=A0A370TT53_9HELO|nr:putative glucosidase 2 subunit alpha [Venustampulla echinocandica]RDL38678.1 putative glucosidase 2 subunit alpha [Venustampulla echinocandica]
MRSYLALSSQWTALFVLLSALCCLFTPAVTVKHENFKTCDQSGFCKRNRAYADTAAGASGWSAPYQIAPESLSWDNGQLQGTILKTINKNGETVRLPITISFLESGSARVTVDEEKRQKGEIDLRHNSIARKERYNEVESWAIVGGLELSKTATESRDTTKTTITYGPEGKFEAVITFAPFGVEFKRDAATQIKFNDRGLLNMEHWRPKIDKAEPEKKEGEEAPAADEESTWWDESFGGATDSKPRGPESVALDITFPGYEHVFGIPEHAGPMSLKETRGGSGNYEDPYRLYNSDVFEYITDSPMTLYGNIPFMQAHRKDSTVGVFWLNAAETWIDIVKQKEAHNPLSLGIGSKTDTKTHWISESGLLDVFVFLGPTPKDVTKAYGELTGYTQLPQSFSIAYHQCRWNYNTDEDVKDVDRKMSKHQIPYDVIWLDIEYTDDKQYFTWDPLQFPDPIGMLNHLDKSERKLVAIIDPHIKNKDGYPIVEDLKKKDLAVHNKDGNIYEGWCWPGSSHWVDCFNPAAIKWWVGLFKYDAFKGSLSNLFVWNDMNEPSVFNGPETTMPKDNLHYENWEHRDVHNLNGMTFHNATYQALLERKKGEIRRPFVLTRAFYSGSQRLGAMWTGDNQASWEHLAIGFPMILNNGIAGYPFAGADVGGFFGNPEKDLLTRWYQAGAFYPFFRGHAHIDTRRREPYLAGEPYTEIMTRALRLRYALLPAWYTAFHEASVDGTPIIRPQYFVYPGDEDGFAIDDQFFVGGTGLLAKPVVTEGAESVDIYLADDEIYYDYFDYEKYSGRGLKTIPAPLEKIPLLMQGGHIIPRKDRPRRSSGLMKWDPYTLVIVLGNDGTATGELYVDDGETFDYQSGAYIHRTFEYKDGVLASTNIGTKGKLTDKYLKAMKSVTVERVVVVGAPKGWEGKKTVKVGSGEANLEFHGEEGNKAAWAVVKKPQISIGEDWKIEF